MTVWCVSCGVMIEARSQLVAADESARAENEAAEFARLLHAMILHRLQDHPEDSSLNEVMTAAAQIEASRFYRCSESTFENLRVQFRQSLFDRLAAPPVAAAPMELARGRSVQ